MCLHLSFLLQIIIISCSIDVTHKGWYTHMWPVLHGYDHVKNLLIEKDGQLSRSETAVIIYMIFQWRDSNGGIAWHIEMP